MRGRQFDILFQLLSAATGASTYLLAASWGRTWLECCVVSSLLAAPLSLFGWWCGKRPPLSPFWRQIKADDKANNHRPSYYEQHGPRP